LIKEWLRHSPFLLWVFPIQTECSCSLKIIDATFASGCSLPRIFINPLQEETSMNIDSQRANRLIPQEKTELPSCETSGWSVSPQMHRPGPGVVFAGDGRCLPGETIGTDSNDLIRIGTHGPAIAQGRDGDDLILGHPGNDEIHGGKGNDILDGKGGADRYVWHFSDFGGRDKVLDFQPGDRLVIDGLLYTDAPLQQKLNHLSFNRTGKFSFSLDIRDGEDGRVLQGIDLYSSGVLPVGISDHQALRLLLDQGALEFVTN